MLGLRRVVEQEVRWSVDAAVGSPSFHCSRVSIAPAARRNGFVCSPANAVRFAAQVCGGAAVEKMLLEETALKVKGPGVVFRRIQKGAS